MIAAVAFPVAVPGVYDYRVPPAFLDRVAPGVPVFVPLRSRQLWGIVVALRETSAFPDLKEIIEVKTVRSPEDAGAIVRLYEWIAAYYCCDLGRVFKPFMQKKIAEKAARMVAFYRGTGTVPADLTPKQALAAASLATLAAPLEKAEIKVQFGLSDHLLAALLKAGVIAVEKKQMYRETAESYPELVCEGVSSYRHVLSPSQQDACSFIGDHVADGLPFLLHGITGSGKTHVYIDMARAVRAAGRGVIILVPEIALTPQTIQRFAAALGEEIAVIHSRMSDGERRDSIEDILSGRRRIVIGVRSAILAPMDDVGLIVVDEEHDGSYKQSDPEPRYHARDTAIMRGRFQHCPVILGSATPSFESYHNALSGKYHLVHLAERFGDAALPSVTIVDMNAEFKAGNKTFLSALLDAKIRETLAAKRQIVLLLNRRGFSVSLVCSACGHTCSCAQCSVKLTFHKSDGRLRCHQCGFEDRAPSRCEKCGGEEIAYQGTGIQKAEEYLQERYPLARIIRMDQDTTRLKGSHVDIIEAFAAGEADILLGTQMVAKGLNFPGVRLVGVLQADTGLHLPDFRATEKTFQLLTQVAGRAGRNDDLGEVIVQTRSPRDPGVLLAARHDFEAFYAADAPLRQELCYPPFGRLARILVSGSDVNAAQTCIDGAALTLRRFPAISVLGPAPAVIERIGGLFRFALLVRSVSARSLNEALAALRKEYLSVKKPAARLVIDVDPVTML